MDLTPRPYRDEADWQRLMALLSALWAGDGGLRSVEPAGGYCWWRRHPGWQETLTLWEDTAGRLKAFLSLESGRLEVHVHPEQPREATEARLIEWAEAQWERAAGAQGKVAEFSIGVSDQDDLRLHLLSRLGYRSGDVVEWLGLFRDLDGPIEIAPLPPGFEVRPFDPDGELEVRLAAVRSVWSGNRVSAASYREIMRLRQYWPELDLAAVAPDGTHAAFCLGWLDAANRMGEFEPVGTRPEYRRRGLGRAVVLEGMRRMQRLGARTAHVFCHRHSEPALALYRSCGLEVRRRDLVCTKRLG